MPTWINGAYRLTHEPASQPRLSILYWNDQPVLTGQPAHLLAALVQAGTEPVEVAALESAFGPSASAQAVRTAQMKVNQVLGPNAVRRPANNFRELALEWREWQLVTSPPAAEEQTHPRVLALSSVGNDEWSALQGWLNALKRYETPHSVQALIASGRIGTPKLVVADVVLDFPWDRRVALSQIDFDVQADRTDPIEGLAVDLRTSLSERRAERLRELGESNRRKLYFTTYDPPVIDQGNRVRFTGGVYDFAWSDSLRRCSADVLAALASGSTSPDVLPRRFDNHIVCVTSDRKLLAALRSRGITTPSHWMTTLGESFDPDIHAGQTIDVARFVRHTLSDTDELNIEPSVAESAEIVALGVGTEWDSMMGNVLCYVKLPVDYAEVRRRFTPGEFLDLDGMDFTLRNSLRLVAQGRHFSPQYATQLDLVPCSVMTLLLALLAEFGPEPLMNSLSA